MTGVAIFTAVSLGVLLREKPLKNKTRAQQNFPTLFFFYSIIIAIYLSTWFQKSKNFLPNPRWIFEIDENYYSFFFFFIENDISRKYRATLFVNILLSYISCLTEISNVSKEKTETAKRTANISRRVAGRYAHGFCRPRPSRNTKY